MTRFQIGRQGVSGPTVTKKRQESIGGFGIREQFAIHDSGFLPDSTTSSISFLCIFGGTDYQNVVASCDAMLHEARQITTNWAIPSIKIDLDLAFTNPFRERLSPCPVRVVLPCIADEARSLCHPRPDGLVYPVESKLFSCQLLSLPVEGLRGALYNVPFNTLL